MPLLTIAPRRQQVLLILCALTHALATCALALTRLYSYKASLLDDGVFSQFLWNAAHHTTPLFTMAPPKIYTNWLGFHFSPVLYLLLPFYAIWPHLELLQITQSLCFGFTGVILFHALQAAGAKAREAWIGSALFWFNPFVVSAAVWDFHEIAFATLFITIALWALCAKRFTAFILALILLLFTKEQYGLSVVGFGFLWGWRHREWKRAMAVMMCGITFMAALFGLIMPTLGGNHSMMAHSGTVVDRYSWLGDPWPRKLQVLNFLLFERTHNSPGIVYICVLLMSTLMLPLAAPFYLAPAGADLFANLLATNSMPRSMGAYHSAAMIPVMLLAAYQGYRVFEARSPLRKDLWQFAMMSMGVMISLAGFIIPLCTWEISGIKLSYDRAIIEHIKTLLPEGAITAQNNIGPFFAQRPVIYFFPHHTQESAAVILYLVNPFTSSTQDKSNIVYGEPASSYFAHVFAIMQDPHWHIAYWQAPWLVMTRDDKVVSQDIRDDIEAHIVSLKARSVINP